jgi:hypothetical protein
MSETTDQRGVSPLEVALGLMLLVVPMAIIALSVAPVFEHRNFVRRAAGEAARVMAVAESDPEARARSAVEQLTAGFGVDPGQVTVRFCDGGCSLDRGSLVVVEVEAVVEELSPFLPIGRITVSATHAEQVDPYRSRP